MNNKYSCVIALCITTAAHAMHSPIHPIFPSDLLGQMTLEQKIAQLLMVPVVADYDDQKEFMAGSPYRMDPKYVKHLVRDYQVGGIIFMGMNTQKKQIKLTNALQDSSLISLLVGLDAEWGAGMRVKDAISFPKNMCLGAVSDGYTHFIETLGQAVGVQCRDLGVHINFAPVVDVNNNPNNPVIGDRSFGQDPERVIKKAAAYMRGLRSKNIIPCIKHFPGHGSTETDSHYTLPTVNKSRAELDAVELYPFKELITKHDVEAVMVGHLNVPALTGSKKCPVTFSKAAIDILKKEYGFSGLVVSDGLGMQALTTKNYLPGKIELKALMAGCDLLVAPVKVRQTIKAIKHAITQKKLSEEELNEHVLKILKTKQLLQKEHNLWLRPMPIETFNKYDAFFYKKCLYNVAVTVAKNSHHQIPLPESTPDIFIATCGAIHTTDFFNYFTEVCKGLNNVISVFEGNDEKAKVTCPPIIAVHGMTRQRMNAFGMQEEGTLNYGIKQSTIDLVKKYAAQGIAPIVVLFGSPYAASYFKDDAGALIVAYDEDQYAQHAAALIILGIINAEGILPITL